MHYVDISSHEASFESGSLPKLKLGFQFRSNSSKMLQSPLLNSILLKIHKSKKQLSYHDTNCSCVIETPNHDHPSTHPPIYDVDLYRFLRGSDQSKQARGHITDDFNTS
jgi:hypothetical protein